MNPHSLIGDEQAVAFAASTGYHRHVCVSQDDAKFHIRPTFGTSAVEHRARPALLHEAFEDQISPFPSEVSR
ncbi:hypothetical protein, partial [Paracoccus rhizosphaerae]